MFFAVKKLAEKYKELLFCSVGDHLSKDDQQNYIKADISVAAKFGQSITPEIIKELDDQTRWIVQLDCLTDRNCYLFIIDKETQFITARSIIQK